MSPIVSQNAFIEKLGPDFDLSRMLIVDFMHEFELGVWKTLFTQLIRILYAAAPGGTLVADLDKRYDSAQHYNSLPLTAVLSGLIRFRDTPQFSQTIHRFTNNVSKMKKLAARDYEDILQVGLFQAMLRVPSMTALSVPSLRLKVFSASPTINV